MRNRNNGRFASLAFLLLCLGLATEAVEAQVLVNSGQPLHIGLSLQENILTLQIETATPNTLTIFCPITPGIVEFNGLTAKATLAYNPRTQRLTLTVPAGRFQIAIRGWQK